MLMQAGKRSIVMRRKFWVAPRIAQAMRTVAALKSATLEHREQITNWLGVLTLLALGVVWL